MTMAICSTCGGDFEKNPQTKRQHHCKPCKREYDRKYHASRGEEEKKRKAEKQLERVHENKRKIYQYLLQHPCENCPETDPIVLDFDHIDPSQKTIEVSLLYNHSWENILKEIAKCRVLCANCHRRHTAVQMGWYKYIEAQVQVLPE